jgi:aspartyl-tRNA(Asn)/glutamyl-tRNA(Gln) amidotransferase subunit B
MNMKAAHLGSFFYAYNSEEVFLLFMSSYPNIEPVIGLEIHVQLSTQSKLFCGDAVNFGNLPNTQVSNISLAHPGILPKTNRTAVEFAVKMGLACDCLISSTNFFARKNYFYPDLPKGYQVSQHTVPICSGGTVSISLDGSEKKVILNRIHLEEDAGKSIHDVEQDFSLIDLNRAGTALIEIVTEPCISTAEEACQYVSAIRKLVRWLNISDADMEKGNLRCDANISVRRKGESRLGTKVEVKNLNSIRNLRKAIEVEVDRLSYLLENGKPIIQQTRSFDAATDTTFALRDKEEANDYRYFPDPDIAPFVLSDEYIEAIRSAMPELPSQLEERLENECGLSVYDAHQLTDDKEVADFFLAITQYSKNHKAIANWINGPVKQQINDRGCSLTDLHLNPSAIAELISLVAEGKVSFSAASSKVLPLLIGSGKAPTDVIQELNLFQVNDEDELISWIDAALNKMPDKVAEYRKGKKGLIGLFVGEVKKLSKGKADPKLVNDLLEKKLNN